jgi:hypothetical protein
LIDLIMSVLTAFTLHPNRVTLMLAMEGVGAFYALDPMTGFRSVRVGDSEYAGESG